MPLGVVAPLGRASQRGAAAPGVRTPAASSGRARFGAGLDVLGQADLVVLGEQRVPADVAQVEADEVLVVSAAALIAMSATCSRPEVPCASHGLTVPLSVNRGSGRIRPEGREAETVADDVE